MARGTLPSLAARGAPLSSPAAQLARLRAVPIDREFPEALTRAGRWPLRPSRLEILQINVGKVCNQTCRHCHVDAGPDRTESMSRETMEQCLRALAGTEIATVDLTGGAPELNPHFRWLVEELRGLGLHVMDRCNLTVLQTAPHRDLVDFFARHRVEVVASLPHVRALGTDRQRGEGVYEASIAALKRLNAVGYGDGRSGLRLVLVTNPVGAFLPGNQASLEAEWKRELFRVHGIRFDALYTLANLPISRFLEWLETSGNLESYLQHLVQAFNPATVPGLMCRNTLSVGWDGRLYDCDFNQMLELGVDSPVGHIARFDLAALEQREVRVARHCFGCTAGAGSSCGGAVT
ncbi:MAG: radical SAM/Cys-rich domain protein [Myxococcaceae bacterium]|nr:MAG: radical SAM/Cys-rich domain protein [Myxococcaceae bacterium]